MSRLPFKDPVHLHLANDRRSLFVQELSLGIAYSTGSQISEHDQVLCVLQNVNYTALAIASTSYSVNSHQIFGR